jgi:hypothetical protein
LLSGVVMCFLLLLSTLGWDDTIRGISETINSLF